MATKTTPAVATPELDPALASFKGSYDEIPAPAWTPVEVSDGFSARLHRAHVLASLIPGAVEAGEWEGTDPIAELTNMLIEEIRGVRALANRVDAILSDRGLVAAEPEVTR
jgi:hypothetical protein